MTDIRYTIHPTKPWLAAIDVENFPGCDSDTDEGKENLVAYASMIFFQDKAIQHVVIRCKGKVIGEIANDGSGFDEQTLQ
jgi:hypothetical protein